MAAVTVDATARNSYYSAGNIGWQARSAFAYRTAIQQLTSNSQANTGNTDSTYARAQSFTPGANFSIERVIVAIAKVASPADNLTCEIRADNSGKPSTTVLATAANSYNGANLSTTYSWLEFIFTTPLAVTNGTKYWIVLQRSGATDATNYYRWQFNSGGVYGGGGSSVYTLSTTTWGAEVASTDYCFQILTVTPSALYQVTQDTGASPKVHMWKSTDAGANWSEVDSANAPTVTDGTYPFDACDTRSGPYIGVAYFTATNTIRGRAFDMSADTWGSEWGATDANTAVSNERSIRVELNNVFTTATHGVQLISFTSNTDDADLGHAVRAAGAWGGSATQILSINSTEASLVSASVTDKAPIGFAHRFYYDCLNDDFSMRSVTGTTNAPTSGTETDVDSSAAADETKYASACYQIYQASGVDKIVAAYIDSDDTIQERTAQLEVTSASVTLGTQHQVSSATTTAGRQLATCSYGGDLYVVVSKSGTAIDYYVDTGAAGSWSAATNWKTGLTGSSISNVLSIEGYGLLVTYTDNGDVKVDWIVAPSSGAVTGTVSTGTLSTTGVAMTATTGVVATVSPNAMSVTGVAMTGTPTVAGTVTPQALATTGVAMSATTGVVGTVAPNAMATTGVAIAATTGVAATISPNAMSVTGVAITAAIGDTGTVAAGAQSVTGVGVTAATGVAATVTPQALSVTGVGLTAATGTTATVIPDTLAVTGVAIAATTGTVATISTGAQSVTGVAITGTTGTVATISTGAIATTGQSVSGSIATIAAVTEGTLATTGQAVSATTGTSATISAGAQATTGQAISATTGTVATLTTGTLAITGVGITGATGTTGLVSTGALTVDGQPVTGDTSGGTPVTGTIDAGTLSTSGQAIAAVYGITGTITTGSLSITGQTTTATSGTVASVTTGAQSVSGQALAGTVSTTGALTTGVLAVTGQTIDAAAGVTGILTTGSVTVSGQPIDAAFGVTGTIDTGMLVVTGEPVTAIIATAAIPTAATWDTDEFTVTLDAEQPAATFDRATFGATFDSGAASAAMHRSGFAARWEKR